MVPDLAATVYVYVYVYVYVFDRPRKSLMPVNPLLLCADACLARTAGARR